MSLYLLLNYLVFLNVCKKIYFLYVKSINVKGEK